MDTLKIKIVLAAAKYKSLSRAAEEFSYTPSAFSHTLSSFEKQLGIRIFARSSVGVELTREGKELIPYFEAVLKSEAELFNAASGLTDGRKCELKIGTYSSISRNFLTQLVKGFRHGNKDIKISVSVADDLNGWLEEGKADIVFADEKVLLKNNFFPLIEDEYYVIAPHGWFSERDSINYGELFSYTYIDNDDKFTRDHFSEEKFPERIYFKSEDDLSVINAVKEGIGFAVLPELVLKENLRGVSVMRLLPRITRTLGFAYKKHSNESAALVKFVKYLKKVKI